MIQETVKQQTVVPSLQEAGPEVGQIDSVDVLIIGTGIIGCGIARELSKYNLRILAIDPGDELASPAAGAQNSPILLDEDGAPGTLKAKLAIKGDRMLTQWAHDLGFEAQPIADPRTIAMALAENAAMNGVRFLFNCTVADIMWGNGRFYGAVTSKGIIQAHYIINCAGLNDEEITAMAGDRSYGISDDDQRWVFSGICPDDCRDIPPLTRNFINIGGIQPNLACAPVIAAMVDGILSRAAKDDGWPLVRKPVEQEEAGCEPLPPHHFPIHVIHFFPSEKLEIESLQRE